MGFSITKLSGIGLMIFGIGGIVSGKLDVETGIQNILVGLAILRGRSAIDRIRTR